MECTTIALGNRATKDGSTLVSYNADCAECDWRLNKVPPKDWPPATQRPVYLLSGTYPLHLRNDHGSTWNIDNLEQSEFTEQWKEMKGTILGYIPQVDHTFGYVEGLYGIMNEHQVSIGESTCASKLWAAPLGSIGASRNGGQGLALFEVSELSQIAMERARTAREAIQIIGSLAEKYGFYSADYESRSPDYPNNVKGEGGEALSIVDPHEAWIFHIVPDDTGTSAVWVAQKVDDDHVSVVANQFVIREVIKDDPRFMYSANLWSVAESLNYWHPSQGNLNFLKTYGITRLHPSYSNLRVWRVFSILAPESSILLTPDCNSWADEYPFSVKVESLVTELDLMKITRDHYQNTIYDTSSGIAGGPYGDPNRFDVAATTDMTKQVAQSGSFPRTISMFRTSYSFVGKPRSYVPDELSLLFYTQYAPDISTFTPIYVNSKEISSYYTRGSMHKYDTNSAWWNFCVIGNYISRFYRYAIEPIREIQERFANDFNLKTSLIDTQVIELLNEKKNTGNTDIDEKIKTILTDFTIKSGNDVNQEYINLFPKLLTRFRDGYDVDTSAATVEIKPLFYPKWWLESVHFFDSIPNSDGILFTPSPPVPSITSTLVTLSFLSIIIIVFYIFGYKRHKKYSDYRIIMDNSTDKDKIELKKVFVNC